MGILQEEPALWRPKQSPMQKRVRVDENWVLARGQKVHGPRWFRVEEYLGRGAFAAAYRVSDADGEEYFLKEYLPPEHPGQLAERRAMYRQERRVLMRVSGHELCPTLHAAFSDCGADYLVQDFIHGRDMEAVLRSGETRGEARILRWAVCLTRAVAHLHAQRIVHHDLKPANIRLNLDDDPVLLDFGAARDFTLPEDATAEYGTDGYMPPERAAGSTPLEGDQALAAGQQTDVFALGAISVEAMIGQRLSQEEINAQKERLFGALIHSATLPPAFVHAVFKALAYDPRRRYPSAQEMLDDLLVIAPPVGRVDRRFLDFGRVELGIPLRRTIAAYNAGGGLLQTHVEVDGDWLQVSEPGGHGAARRALEGNRQSIVVTALPERVPRSRTPEEGEVRFVFPSGMVRVRCAIERPPLPAEIQVSPSSLQIWPGPRGHTSAALTFRNSGELAAGVSLHAHPPDGIRFEPPELEIEAGGSAAVAVTWHAPASQANHLRDWLRNRRRHFDVREPADGQAEYLLEWRVDGEPGGFIPLEMATIGGLARAVAHRLRRVAAEHGLSGRSQEHSDAAGDAA
jgi:tRNA A-37 threonylcarbamoyl transferase component Bud32